MNTKNIVWTPGMKDDKTVRVKYNLPVRFRLEGGKKKKEKRKWWQRKN